MDLKIKIIQHTIDELKGLTKLSDISADTPLSELGVSSLMLAELDFSLKANFNLELDFDAMSEDMSINEIATMLVNKQGSTVE